MRSSGSKKTLSDRVQLLLRDFNKWSALSIATALLMALPILLVALGLFDGVGEMWQHLVQYLLLDYLSNSAILLLGTGILCTFVGVACAWCVCQYDFPLRSLLSQLLLLPLAIPSYVVAYAYVGTFGNSGSLQTLLASFGIGYQKLHLMNSYGLIWVLSMSLFPYVYISTRAAFWSQSIRLEEAAYLLGASSRRYWRTIVLPLAQPAIVGGLFLVFMEVLNDYGAAKYYGIRTFTTGIFRTWTALEDLQTAIYLSAILVLLVLSLRWLERWQRGRRSYAAKGNSIQRPRQQLSKPNAYLMSFAVALPFFFGFLLPVGQLTYWAILTFNTVFNIELFWIAAQAC
ncbi:MAG: ABC transporter permease subunit, partial [Bacteroidota bacterium]